jgi:hypothetical protein
VMRTLKSYLERVDADVWSLPFCFHLILNHDGACNQSV